jgi:hypothetical protein
MHTLSSSFVLLFLFLLPFRSYADSISCSGGIVSSGDRAVDLLIKCGQPEWKDTRSEEIVEGLGRDARRSTFVTEEDWTYNFGPDQFMRIVTIRNGVISEIRTAKSGAAKDREPAGPECGGRVISTGDTKADVLIRCGEPFYKTSHQEELKERFDGIGGRRVTVTIDEWTYNFGPQRFLRIITFRNGTVIDVRTGNYGR